LRKKCFTLNSFEAGKPFHIELGGYIPQGNNTSGMMFLRRIENQ
jgi:hypothetical protein